MERIIPYSKLSKKKKKELDSKKRRTWGALSPVTRCAHVPGAYNRGREKIRTRIAVCNEPG